MSSKFHSRGVGRKGRIDLFPYLLNIPAIIVLGIVIGVPLVQVLIMSLSEYSFFGNSPFVGLDNFIRLFTRDRVFWSTVRNTVIWTFVSISLEFTFALAISLLMNRIIHMKGFLRGLSAGEHFQRNGMSGITSQCLQVTQEGIGMIFNIVHVFQYSQGCMGELCAQGNGTGGRRRENRLRHSAYGVSRLSRRHSLPDAGHLSFR